MSRNQRPENRRSAEKVYQPILAEDRTYRPTGKLPANIRPPRVGTAAVTPNGVGANGNKPAKQ
jgi:hypothetical protein